MNKYNAKKACFSSWAIFLLLVVVMTLSACSQKVVHPPLDVTFLPQKGAFISKNGDPLFLEEIIEMTMGKDYVLIGESHKNICDHKVQQRLVAALADTETPPAIGLEMIAVDMQPILDDFGKGQVEVDALEEELQWSTRWGYPFSFFRGLFAIAQQHSLPVAGLNVPSSVTKKLSKEGMDSLTEDERALLPAQIVKPGVEQMAMLDMIFAQHDGRDADNATQRNNFIQTQSIWDSKMAEQAVALHRKYDWPVVIIAGYGHVEHGWGIARRIRKFDPEANILSLMPWRGGPFDPEGGDAFFYCPDSYESKMGALLTATGSGGLLVESVKRESRAAKAGLRPGDLLIEASGIELDYLMSLHMAGKKVHEADQELVFTVRRGSTTFTTSVGKLGQTKPKSPDDQQVKGE
jgi:uncharacterized iron-regulated protein